jgi:hypothetical protein
VTLTDVCSRLHVFDRESTIYAREPWTPASDAIVAVEPEDGGLPDTARRAGMTYFIEVFIALEVLEDWDSNVSVPPNPAARVQRLIEYAIHDA